LASVTAVFFSPSRALTAYQTVEPEIGAGLTGKAKEDSRTWKLRVVATSVVDNLVVLECVEGPLVSACMPLAANTAIEHVGVPEVWVAYFGVRALRCARTGVEILVGNFCDKAEIAAVGTRHLVFSASGGRGDAGGAILNVHGNLIGLQLGRWNMVSPPPPPAVKNEPCTSTVPGMARTAEEEAEDVAAAAEQQHRVARMGLAEVGSEARQWVLAMASSVRTGGYGVFLGSPAITALLEAAESSGAGGGSGDGFVGMTSRDSVASGSAGETTSGVSSRH
jgi:hypothetical protein